MSLLRKIIAAATLAIAAIVPAACGDAEAEDRGAAAVAVCRGHGGVIAFDDEVVICRDQSSHRIE